MKVEVANLFTNILEKTVEVFNQKELESIFGKCFLVSSNTEGFEVSFGDVFIFSKLGANITTEGYSYVEDYKKEELENFIVSETTNDSHVKKATLKYRLKKVL
jgi:hypothetical protein